MRKKLTYTNTAIQYEAKRHYNNFWARRKDEKKWESTLEEIRGRIKRTLVFSDEIQSVIYIRPGSCTHLDGLSVSIQNNIVYPVPKPIAWAKPLPFNLYPYQEESWQKLLAVKHGNVELCTGSGKSAIILKVCRETGFKTAIVVPSKSIFHELLEKFEYHFGKGKVGAFGDGKKKLGKLFTVCISDSLCNIKQGTEEWKFFSNLDMMLVDESHTFAAETLEDICFGVLKDIPYRFFCSGTQARGDGTEKLLQAIIGPTVCTLTTAEAIAGGYICYHDFAIVSIESSNPNFYSKDPLSMKRAHFLKNRNICAFIAKLVNAQSSINKKQSLVLVEELEQISMLLPLLKVPVAIAHSESKADRLAELGLSKVDPAESVELFNKNQVSTLIGTKCIATGTNIYPTHHTFNWSGGASEVATKQGPVGRSVRIGTHNPWAKFCTPKDKSTIWDFNVYDVEKMVDHLEERIKYYKESGTEIKRIKLNK